MHRDIKPANIMLDDAQSVKIADFGLAKPLNSATDLTHGLPVGTLEYMSPEQLDSQSVDGHTDQYALAVIAYRLLTGCRIFPAETAAVWCAMILQKTPTPASERNPALPRAVDAVLARALNKVPATRYDSCTQFVAALGRALNSAADDQVTRTLTALRQSVKKDHNWREIAGTPKSIAAAIGTLVLLLIGWLVIARPHGSPSLIPVKVAGQDGVSVHIGSNECVTPDCTLSFAPGNLPDVRQ